MHDYLTGAEILKKYRITISTLIKYMQLGLPAETESGKHVYNADIPENPDIAELIEKTRNGKAETEEEWKRYNDLLKEKMMGQEAYLETLEPPMSERKKAIRKYWINQEQTNRRHSDQGPPNADVSEFPDGYYGISYAMPQDENRAKAVVREFKKFRFKENDFKKIHLDEETNIRQWEEKMVNLKPGGESNFPELNIPALKIQAKRWAEKYSGISFKSIVLFPYASDFQAALARKIPNSQGIPTKYAVVFDISEYDSIPKELYDDFLSDIGCLETLPPDYFNLMASDFTRVYKGQAPQDFKNEWRFFRPGAPGAPTVGIRFDEPCCVLYGAENVPLDSPDKIFRALNDAPNDSERRRILLSIPSPELTEEYEKDFALFSEIGELEKEIEKLKLMPTPLPSEHESLQRQIKELESKIAEIRQKAEEFPEKIKKDVFENLATATVATPATGGNQVDPPESQPDHPLKDDSGQAATATTATVATPDNNPAQIGDNGAQTFFKSSKRNDRINLEIEAVLQSLGPNAKPKDVMKELKKRIGKEDSCIRSWDPKQSGLIWTNYAGAEKVLDREKLQKRLKRKSKNHL